MLIVLVIEQVEQKHPFWSWIVSLFPKVQKTRLVSSLSVQVGHLLHWQRCSTCLALLFWSALDMFPIKALNFSSKVFVDQVSMSAIQYTNASLFAPHAEQHFNYFPFSCPYVTFFKTLLEFDSSLSYTLQ